MRRRAAACWLRFADTPGATAADDFVMVGTGELQAASRPPVRPALAGRGILAALGPAAATDPNPWEDEAGHSALEDLGVFALARDPAATAGRTTGPGTGPGSRRHQPRLVRRHPPAGRAAARRRVHLGAACPGSARSWARRRDTAASHRRTVATPRADPNGRILLAVALGFDTVDRLRPDRQRRRLHRRPRPDVPLDDQPRPDRDRDPDRRTDELREPRRSTGSTCSATSAPGPQHPPGRQPMADPRGCRRGADRGSDRRRSRGLASQPDYGQKPARLRPSHCGRCRRRG